MSCIEEGKEYKADVMTIPKKITPSPIIEAIAELRFENDVSSAVIFGKLYALLASTFPETQQLPVLDIPQEMLDKQPDIKYSPHYRLKNDNYVVGIGQRSLTINRLCLENQYTSWEEYSEVIQNVFTEFQKISPVEKVTRVSIVYVNFFEGRDLKDILNLEVSLLGKPVTEYDNLSATFATKPEDGVATKISINSNAKVTEHEIEGAVENITVFKEGEIELSEISDLINSLHGKVEEVFFNSLTQSYLTSLDPAYE